MARKWENSAVIKRKRISLPKKEAGDINSRAPIAHKGHFVVYTTDQKRFLIPLKYLNEMIFRELLKLSEEEFGFQINGRITLPFDASVLEYIILLLERGATKDLENFLLMSVVTTCSTSLSIFDKEQTKQRLLVYGY